MKPIPEPQRSRIINGIIDRLREEQLTTYKKIYTLTGDLIEIRTNPGASPIIYRNGVIDPVLTIDMFSDYLALENKKWETVTIWRPRKINGRWYGPGSKLYRRYVPGPIGVADGRPIGGNWVYGDDFDLLRNV